MYVAAISNLFSIEDSITEHLKLLTDYKKIYSSPVSEFLNEKNIETPALIIDSNGIISGQSAVRVKHQKIITLWEIGIICPRKEYKTFGGMAVIQLIKHLNGYQADDWINPARLVPEKDKSDPIYNGDIALFPLLFEVEIII